MENLPETKKENAVMPSVPGEMTVESIERSVQIAEAFVKAADRIRKAAIHCTSSADWVDQSGNPYLEYTGAAKIQAAFRCRIFDVKSHTERITDSNGEYIKVTFSGSGEWNGNQIHEIGVATSRDEFFAKKTQYINGEKCKVILPLSEIDVCDIDKKAHTNFMNRMIKNLLGLSFSWDEIEKISEGKIRKSDCAGVTYDKGKKGGSAKQDSPELIQSRSELRQVILDLCDGDAKKASESLIKLTANEEKGYSGYKKVDEIPETVIKWLLPKCKHMLKEKLDLMASQEQSK